MAHHNGNIFQPFDSWSYNGYGHIHYQWTDILMNKLANALTFKHQCDIGEVVLDETNGMEWETCEMKWY